MKLKQLELCGFKSFPDKTTIPFPGGVSAVVGPNGCGKSNIVDAIQWVTGEQRARQLRGKSMEDVIFSGSKSRPPVNMAEVSITFANDNGSCPEEYRDFSEIMVTRRLYRSGERGYFINKQPCRLKDIQNLLMGSGIGAGTYAVIQQGNLGAITEAGPDERRIFIEEAAGITRYKARKKEAQSKIKSTRTNLLRVMDIITEVERNMASLSRQAKKAERYKEYKKRIEKIDIALAALEFDRYTQRISETHRLLQELKDQEISHVTQLSKLDAAMEEIRQERASMAEDVNKKEIRCFELQRQVDRMEKDLQYAKTESSRLAQEAGELESQLAGLREKQERIVQDRNQCREDMEKAARDLEQTKALLTDDEQAVTSVRQNLARYKAALEEEKSRLTQLLGNEAKYSNIYQNAANTKQDIARRLRQLSEEVVRAGQREQETKRALADAEENLEGILEEAESVKGELVYIEQALEEKRAELGDQLRKVQTLDMERSRSKSQLSALKRMEGNMEWFQKGVREVVAWDQEKNKDDSRILGVLADVVKPEPGYEEAVEAALGEALQFVIVKDKQTALDAMEHLAEVKKGRAGFMPVSWVDSGFTPGSLNHASSLLQHVEAADGCGHLIKSLLSDVLVAEDAKAAVELKNGYNDLTVVTKDGVVLVSPRGIVGGGQENSGPGILAQRQQLTQLEETIASLEEELETAKESQEALEKETRGLETDLQRMVEGLRDLGREEMEAQKEVSRLKEDSKLAARHHQIVISEQDQLMGEEDDAEEELSKYKELVDEAVNEVQQAEEAVKQAAVQVEQAEAELDGFSEKTTDLRVEISALSARLDNQKETYVRLAEFEEENQKRLEYTEREAARRRSSSGQSSDKIEELESRLTDAYTELTQAKEALEKVEISRQQIENSLKESDAMQARIKNERESHREKVRDLELSQSQRKVRQEAVASRILEKLGRPLTQARNDEGLPDVSDPKLADEAAMEMDDLRQKIGRMGDVHLGAINEYEALQERYEFLTQQRDDLMHAIESLEKVIRKINRFTQKKFMETFQKVNEKLALVFPRLFHGGSAEIKLSEPDKPLETGVEFEIRPQGKKITRMSLLSGGEKALSAIAFVFAIFLIKPASFCLMDEIDAPLDDANVSRFNELLKLIGEKSQIVMVTHNKKSMEFADILYGITMENKGVSKVVSVNLEKAQEAA
ncbi:condensin subunit Smc [Desulfatibacillum alkenivorans DSM 16219]|jgi:chromosome segregation protein|uniref:Chromosome partition protein Smc n=1 Tax=Desulfatibacillum alkenivorans DSM 16219 TaxID=1121393 RepID=A0A1M6SQL3_9BACT|nr:chromosome segregation protein SMC [Desulfatibacillum alkenivorans]SHK47034.1 condensin subunit Smc [Desulfatibacillum alkenivorans DSM 16219]